MSFGETVLLGALAGFTIYLGLPFARLDVLSTRARVALAMFAVGVLTFLLIDVLGHAFELVEGTVEEASDGDGSFGTALGYSALLALGFGLGSAGLATAERWLRRTPPSTPPSMSGGSGEALAGDAPAVTQATLDSAALRTGMTIAAAIGLHNFAEGLAIGVSASTGEISLAVVLIIGFALHNATEGFGIAGPLHNVKPTWGWLALAGLVGGGPTFLGTIVGYNVSSDPLELLFYAVSGGAILYVVSEVWNAMRRFGHRELGLWMLTVGFTIGVLTDLVVVWGGG